MPVLKEAMSKLSINSTSSADDSDRNALEIANEACGIRDVWACNLEEEFCTIRDLVQKYNYIAMDTEFPGVVAQPIGKFRSITDYQYQMLRCNVDLLKIIQLGVTFLDENGNKPINFSTWQFNFKFSLAKDMFAQDSIDLLINSGIQFSRHETEGIDPYEFAQLLMTSGVVLSDDVKWLTFHSGYDFGYLLKVLTGENLPADENDFFELLQLYFPCIYDVKYLMKSCRSLRGGLQEVAGQLQLERIGPQHQAGSDSLLTGAAFFKIRKVFFQDKMDDEKFSGFLYGLGASCSTNDNQMFEVHVNPNHVARILTGTPPTVVYTTPITRNFLP
nr:CCR4-NOT transcription complex subunit 7-like [Dermacentor andersoni]